MLTPPMGLVENRDTPVLMILVHEDWKVFSMKWSHASRTRDLREFVDWCFVVQGKWYNCINHMNSEDWWHELEYNTYITWIYFCRYISYLDVPPFSSIMQLDDVPHFRTCLYRYRLQVHPHSHDPRRPSLNGCSRQEGHEGHELHPNRGNGGHQLKDC